MKSHKSLQELERCELCNDSLDLVLLWEEATCANTEEINELSFTFEDLTVNFTKDPGS